jgi:multiple sugar transport system permease protein
MATQTDTHEQPYSKPSRVGQLRERIDETGISTALVYGALGVFLFWSLFPVYWLVTGAVKTRETLLSFPPHWIPHEFHVANFAQLFVQRPEFVTYIFNSIIVTIITTVLATFIGAAAAYGFTAFDFPYNLDFHLPFYMLSTRFLPPIVTIIPLYVVFRGIGLVNTLDGLILVYVMFNMPFVVWMTQGFFAEVPDSLVESAMIDGHTHAGAFVKIVLPLVKPGLIAAAIFTMIITWNELLFAIIIAQNATAFTIPVGLSSFVTKFSVQWIHMSVAGTIALAPVLLFAFVARGHLVSGFSMGAVEK